MEAVASRQSSVANTVWTWGGTYFGGVARRAGVGMLVVSTPPVIVFEQLGLEHVAQRVDDVRLKVVFGDLHVEGGTVEVRAGR